ncbi:MAG: transglutaminase domain-containing protein [Candidatus Latescibacteria bacterium]|nr:transglutaminase domain-containing protein [Candidatus Latescibacterota bacterium]
MKIATIFVLLLVFLGVGIDPLLANFDLEGLPEPYRKQLIEVLDQSGGNRRQLYQTLTVANSEGYLEAACFLISQMKKNDLDALQADSYTLMEHIEYAYKAKDLVQFDLPEGLFFDYVLNFRIFNEPVTAWRSELFETFYPLVKDVDSVKEAVLIINRWIAENIKVIGSQMVASPVLHILRAGRADKEQVPTLTVAVLRSIAIPSRMAYAGCCGQQGNREFWVEVYIQGRWIPLYPDDPESLGNFSKLVQEHPYNVAKAFVRPYFLKVGRTSEYTQTGTILVTVSAIDQPISLAVHVFNSGLWFPVVKSQTDSQNLIQFKMEEGEYLLAAGAQGQKILLQRIAVEPNETIQCWFDFATDKCEIIGK